MNFFQAIILGIVQALTEYLPVSSSAHIRIIGDLMLGADPGAAFTAIIQIGTELAVILYFRRDIINILSHWFGCLFGKNGPDWRARMGRGDKYATLGWNVIVGSIPIIILGFTLQNIIETSLRNLWITVTVLFLFGLLLWIVDARSRQIKTMDDMNYRDAFHCSALPARSPGSSSTPMRSDNAASICMVACAHSSLPRYCGTDTHIDVVENPSSHAMQSSTVGMPTGPLYSRSMSH